MLSPESWVNLDLHATGHENHFFCGDWSLRRATIVGGAFAIAIPLVLLVLAAGRRTLGQDVDPAATAPPVILPSTAIPPSTALTEAPAPEVHQGFLYGRVTTHGGATYQGRLRWGSGEEAFWGDYFNGFRDQNPWVPHLPPERLMERRTLVVFGVEIAQREKPIDLRRPFMARFGDIARIEADGRCLRVTLKSGTVFHLDRYVADDLADGARVWDGRSGVVDLDERRIRAVELFPTARLGATSDRLRGTVRTRWGEFTGFVQWNQKECVGSDELDGHTAGGELSLRFDTIRSIARDSRDGSLVTLLDGREIVLSGTREVGQGNRGVYVDDPRYGWVLVSWEAFERVDFHPGGSGPASDNFPPGRSLSGVVTTRAGRRLAGRLVYDLDESETTEMLDAPFAGVDYTIPFGLIASIAPTGSKDRAVVTLHSCEDLQLERSGDLGEGNAGMLVFADGLERPEYVPWSDVEQVELDRPAATWPPGRILTR